MQSPSHEAAPTLSSPAEEVARLLAGHPSFVMRDGIPRQRSLLSETQQQTGDTFGYKWQRRDTYESAAVSEPIRDWLIERYRLPDRSLADLIRGRRFLDAGCGSGYSALLLFDDALRTCRYFGIDVSDAVDVARQRFKERSIPAGFVQADLTDLPTEVGTFDFIFSDGVLHHTDSTRNALEALASLLDPGGIIAFYVYRAKGPIREFTDDLIRARLRGMSNVEAWEALMPLTRLGRTLGELDIEIDIPEPIDLLDIPAGRINLQRLVYWHVFKAYHRPGWTDDEMNHVNFDWFRPLNCHRQTAEEVREWCDAVGLQIVKMDLQESGITVVAERPS